MCNDNVQELVKKRSFYGQADCWQMWKVWSIFSVEILFFGLSSCSPVLPPLPLLLNLVDVQCASIISQEKVSNFYNFPGKDQRFLQLPKRWTPFWQPTSKGNLRSRAVKKSAEWKCQHKKPTQHPTLLFWISYSMILKLQIFESSTHTKKTHSVLGWKWLNSY